MPKPHLKTTRAILGLGSNIQAIENLRFALAEIKKLPKITVVEVASIYESDALLPENAHSSWNKKYLNSAVFIECLCLEPFELLQQLKIIERQLGRHSTDKWAPRTIDIDILWIEDFSLQTDVLSIPHTQLLQRPFALLPLLELYPDFPIDNEPDWLRQNPKPFHTQISKTAVWPKIAGILNVTLDSFSGDGDLSSTWQRLEKLAADGADIIDIGAESTRPGASSVDAELEYQRLKNTLDLIVQFKRESASDFEVSVDCRKPNVMMRILDNYEINYLNDVEGFRHAQMRELLKRTKAKAVCMHSLSVPPIKTETIPEDEDVWFFLSHWWEKQKEIFVQDNIDVGRIIFDPGIGFGKTPQQCVDLLNYLQGLSDIKEDIFLGYSRKSFLSLLTDKPAAERDAETALVTESINLAFAQYIRVHNVAQNKQALITRTQI